MNSALLALANAWRRASAELAANARLRVGAWLVLATALVSLALLQADRVQAAHADYAAAADRLQRAKELLAREDWPQLLAAESAAHERIDALLWPAETEGLAQAEMQAVLGDMLRDIGFEDALVRAGVSQPVPSLADVWRVQMRVSGNCDPMVAVRLLHDLAKHPRELVVDRLDYVRNNSRLALLVSAYFALAEGPAGDSGPGSEQT